MKFIAIVFVFFEIFVIIEGAELKDDSEPDLPPCIPIPVCRPPFNCVYICLPSPTVPGSSAVSSVAQD